MLLLLLSNRSIENKMKSSDSIRLQQPASNCQIRLGPESTRRTGPRFAKQMGLFSSHISTRSSFAPLRLPFQDCTLDSKFKQSPCLLAQSVSFHHSTKWLSHLYRAEITRPNQHDKCDLPPRLAHSQSSTRWNHSRESETARGRGLVVSGHHQPE